jgi:CBS domain containing-hemolysin-like protein
MTGVLLVVLFLLIAINGLFVAAEFALVRARRSRIEQLVSDEARGASVAMEELERIDEYLSACQLGITMASIGIGFLGEPAVAKLIEPVFGDLSHGVATAISVGLAYAIVTALHVVVGEQAPKLFAISRPENSLRFLARPLQVFRLISAPITVGLTAAANWIVRLFGVRPADFGERHTTSEDLKALISQSAVGGDLDRGEAVMLSGVFHLHEQEAREVMTPIPAVVTVDYSSNVSDALNLCISSGHNRLVVVEDGNADRVRGIVHALRLVRLMMAEGPEAKIESAVRDALIVPETKPLDDLLTELQRQRSSMGVVVDEYGRTVGIVTVEDILEEVVGEIEDETDPLAGSLRQLTNGDWYVRGHVSLGDLSDRGIELPVDTDAYNSIGGYVFGELGRLPKRGDVISADGFEIRVESVRENRVEAVRIHPAAGQDPR